MTIIYFGYGSNMLTERLVDRCKSAKPIGIATAPGYSLSFFKRSIDKSGKATLAAAEDKTVYGVMFEIARAELPALDQAEGLGPKSYARDDRFCVCRADTGAEVMSTAYVATAAAIDPSLTPYDWYRALVLAGAMQHGLPEGYIDSLRGAAARPDPKPDRESRLAALKALKDSGFAHLIPDAQPA